MKLYLIFMCVLAQPLLLHTLQETIDVYSQLNKTDMSLTAREAFRLMYTIPKSDRYKPYYWPVNTMYALFDGYDVNSKWANST
jgi:hypothetical protein